MELSKRLKMNVALVPEQASVADIGCDHGYCSIYLANEKKCKVIAMDVGRGPISIAERNIAGVGLEHEIQCRLSDGLDALQPGEADSVLVAGMGGMLICRILQKNPDVMEQINTIVVQPQSDYCAVRKMIETLGFHICEESFCIDAGKPYVAICAKRDEEIWTYTEAEYTYGRILPQKRDASYFSYLTSEKEKYENIVLKLENGKTDGCSAGVKEIQKKIALLDEVLNKWG